MPAPLLLILEWREGDRALLVRPGDTLSIGRVAGNDLVLPDPTVGRRHAIVRHDGAALVLEDASSPCGVFRDDRRLVGPTPLAVGDRVRLGGVLLEVAVLRPGYDHRSAITRRAYGEADAAYLVDGQPSAAARLRVRTMNFGQPWRTPGLEEVDVRVTLGARFVADWIDALLPEVRADALAHPDPDDDLARALALRGWPSAAVALGEPELARGLVASFAHDLLLSWLGDGAPDEEPSFVLNGARVEEVADGRPVLAGRARRNDRPVRVQDA
jgi:predicted component of type VI protein secretion system